MSRSAVRSQRIFPLRFPTQLSFRTPVEKLFLLVTVSLWIPWTLACGASAQGATSSNSTPASLSLSNVLPVVIAQQPYTATIAVKGGQPPYQFTVSRGVLPEGLLLDSNTGVISGMAKFPQGYVFEVQVSDQNPKDFGFAIYHLLVQPPRTGGPISIEVSPTAVSLAPKGTQQFSAVLQGTTNPGVQWSAPAGTITAGGVFVAPVVTTRTNVTITASSLADPSKQASALVVVDPPPPTQQLSVQTSSLPSAEAGQPYQATLSASGGTPPYTWQTQNSVPAGFSLASSSGVFSGSTNTAGNYPLSVQVQDSASHTATQSLTLAVASAGTGNGNFDGPAELPRATMQSALSETPAPGKVISVPAGGSLRTAIAGASCGDTIELQAGAVFDGQTVLPALPCDDGHWIIIRTSAPDSALPAEGQRITPCYAGVASLPNRPAYPCSSAKDVMAQITVSKLASTPIELANGANHYRFIGLEITRAPQAGPIVALITPLQSGEADHIIVDRCWVHGIANLDTRRGIALSGVSYVAVINSYLNDFHCTAVVGSCSDSQTLGGGAGDITTAVWQIQNNFLEAAGENILMGGSDATVVPTDITIQGNHFYKVPQWRPGSPNFVGGAGGHPFVVKNHIELKNAARILIEDNIFEYSWGGFSQAGYSMVLSPRNNYNQELKKANGCSICAVTDITIRYDKISHVAAGMSIVTPLTENEMAAAAERFSIHDSVIDDVEAATYKGGGGLFLIVNAWSKNVLNSISIRHVSGFPDPAHSMLVFSNSKVNPEMWGLTFQDNLIAVPTFPVWSAGMWGTANCSFGPTVPLLLLGHCFKPYTFSTNVLMAPSKVYPPSAWPANNMFPASIADVEMTNYNNGNGGNYELLPSSPYKGKASDGADPGADISGLTAALANVY